MTNPLSRLASSLSACLLLSAAATGAPIEQQRPVFLRAEQSIRQGRLAEADSVSPALADYPLYPYLLYQRLDRDLGNAEAVKDFLERYRQTRQAGLLRKHWLEHLAAHGSWAEYATQYRDTENPNLQCLYYLALANTGRRGEALAGAEKLWQTGNSLPESCERLFGLWRASPGFSPEHVWKRFALAMQKGNRDLAASLQDGLPAGLRPQAEFWRKLQDQPRLVLDCSAWNPKAASAGTLFAFGIDRLASDDPLLAQTAWAFHKARFAIDPDESARIDRRTALALAAQRYGQAGAYLMEMPEKSVDAAIRAWRVRTALARQDWPLALLALAGLGPEEKNQAQWRYWRARALEALGDKPGAEADYRLAAQERDFFGLSAADRLGLAYRLASSAAPVTEAEVDRLAATPPFLGISELRALNREGEARSEWLFAIQPLSPHELLIAAKLAQRLGLDNLAIQTAAKAGNFDDLSLRFPLGFSAPLMQAAKSQQVEPTLVYALVRRESAFDPNVGSPAGALGLMQLMPTTGELMARRLNESVPSANALLEPGRNLRYGTAYLRGLLERFGNHFALAAAAYNAGPGRVERWLPADRPLPADLWVESIPFSETRQYVAAVLAHAVVYQNRLGQPDKRIAEWLPDVPPTAKGEAKEDRAVSVPACE